MRTLTLIIAIVVMVFVSSVDADARSHRNNSRPQCICTSVGGTLNRGCPVHGNRCIGQPQHEHPNTRGRSTYLPTFCEYRNYQAVVTGDPQCRRFRAQIQNYENQSRNQERAIRQRERENRRIQNNIPFISDYQRAMEREQRMFENRVRSDIRRDANRLARSIYGR